MDFRITLEDEQEIRRYGDYLGAAGLNDLIVAVRANYFSPTISLSGSVDQVVVRPNPGAGVQVFLRLSIRNEGPPSGAYKYSIRISLHPTIDFKLTPTVLNRNFTLPLDGEPGEIVIQPEDDLARKSGQTMAQGKVVSGWLRFVIPFPDPQLTPQVLRQPGIRYVVSFADANGNPYTATYEMR